MTRESTKSKCRSGKCAGKKAIPIHAGPWPKWPVFDESDIRAVADAIRSGEWFSISGTKVTEFEKAFAKCHGAKYAIATNSGTTALQVAYAAVGVAPGDEVIVPAYTFISTATAALLIGAVPIIVDIEEDTYNIGVEAVRKAITSRTKAIVPVHVAGRVADMKGLLALSREHGIPIVEDACHGHGGFWNDRGLGTIGKAGCFSFQASKNLNAGEGGLILTDDERVAAISRSLMHIGRIEGGGWHEHHLPGGNYRMTEMQGALLLSQMRRLKAQTMKRDQNGRYLDKGIATVPGIRPMTMDPLQNLHPRHLYLFRYNAAEFGMPRAEFVTRMNAEGIPVIPGFPMPLHRQPLFTGKDNRLVIPRSQMWHLARCDYSRTSCPNAERICREEALLLVQSVLLAGRKDLDDIVTAARKVCGAS